MLENNLFEDIECLNGELLKNYSTIKIGGKAKWIVFPKNTTQLIRVFEIAKANNIKTLLIGNGSNLLFADNGFDGVVVSLKRFCQIKRVGDCVWCGSGVNLFALHQKLIQWGLSGLEWSYGIPATVGGIVKMNAGSFGHEICEIVEQVVCLNGNKFEKINKNMLKFGYRCSNFGSKPILWVKFRLNKSLSNLVKIQCEEYFDRKKRLQPYNLPSLGSVFKRCEKDGQTIYPAKMIDNLGLKGVKIGGAEISTKHAGFIVNVADATSKDVLELISLAESECKKQGVDLCREIIVVE